MQHQETDMKNYRATRYSNKVFYFILFLVFTLFFSTIHPLVPFCTDDWININIARPFYPSFFCWNPTKVFPESLEPLASMFAAYVIYPFIHEYTYAFIFTNAITVSLFITIYLSSLHKLLEDRFKISNWICICIVLIFTIFHFLILKVNDNNNDFLLHATDCNCYYHYIIPTLLNASLVMWLMRQNIDLKQMDTISLSCLCLFVYLALFSNLYSSVILIAYVGAVLLFRLISFNKKNNKWLGRFVRYNSFYIIILVCWLLIQLFEVNGIRANAYGHLKDPFWSSVGSTINNFFSVKYNSYFLFTTFGTIIATILVFLKNKKRITSINNNNKILILSLLLTNLYLILLSSKVDPENVLKGNIIFSSVFFFLLMIALCLGFLSKHSKYVKIILPFLLFILFASLNSRNAVFRDVLFEFGYDTQSYIEHNNNIIKQVTDADALGNHEVIINVPEFENPGHYPLSDDCSNFVGFSLYKHNIIKNRIITHFSTSSNNR